MTISINFFCSAGAKFGNGHLRRCLYLAHGLHTSVGSIAFTGSLDNYAIDQVATEIPKARVLPNSIEVEAELTVIDYMFDEQDPGAYDHQLIASAGSNSHRVLLISSSPTVDDGLPVNTIVGHLMEPNQNAFPKVYGGLEYAPVPIELMDYSNDRGFNAQVNSILLAFGNWHNVEAFKQSLAALELLRFQGKVTVLLPSGLVKYGSELEQFAEGLNVVFVNNVNSVIELIREADLVMGGYGNFTYETLAVGRPFILLGVKKFMLEYGQILVDWDCLRSVGIVDEVTPGMIAQCIQTYQLEERQRHAMNGAKLIDGLGFSRMTKLIKSEYKLAAAYA